MDFNEYLYIIRSDLYRFCGSMKISQMIRCLFSNEGGSYKYVFWMRTCNYTRNSGILRYTLYPLARHLLLHYTFKLGISVPFLADIGSGFYIGHYGGIIVSPFSKIGKNCNLSHGVTIGQSNRGKNKGYPVVGNNVYIGPGAKIIGRVVIGDNVAIGANCVVTKDVPDNAVVVGVPGRVISFDGVNGHEKVGQKSA